MSRKIIGVTVGSPLPKPNLMQTDPKKGDYVKGKEEFLEQVAVDLTGYATEQWVQDSYQPKGEYLTAVPDGYAKTTDIPQKPEDIGAQPAGNYLTEVPSGYLQKNELPTAIDTALAQAKASGEFDGKDGQPGTDGKTPVRGTDYWTDADIAEIKSYVDEAILGGAW